MEIALLKKIIKEDLVTIRMNQQTFAKNISNVEDRQTQLVNILSDISVNIRSIKNESKAIRNLLKNAHLPPQIRETLVRNKKTDVFDVIDMIDELDDIETEIDDQSTSDGNLDEVFTPMAQQQEHQPNGSLRLSNMFRRNADQFSFLLKSHEQETAKLTEDKTTLQIDCDQLEHKVKHFETLKSSKFVHKNHRNNSNNSNHSKAPRCSNNSDRRSGIGNVILPIDTNNINTNEGTFQMKPEDELIQLKSVSVYQNKYHKTNNRMSILHENCSESNHVRAKSDDTVSSIYSNNNRKFDINKYQLSSIPTSEESTINFGTINHIKFPTMFHINDARHTNGNNQKEIGIKGSKSTKIISSSQTKLKKRYKRNRKFENL